MWTSGIFGAYAYELDDQGDVASTLPGPPDVTSTSASIRFGDTLEWSMSDSDEGDPSLGTQIYLAPVPSSIFSDVHAITVPPGVTSIVIPEPPAAVDVEERYGAMTNGFIAACELAPELDFLCLRAAWGSSFLLEP